jgi:hypothetical protein
MDLCIPLTSSCTNCTHGRLNTLASIVFNRTGLLPIITTLENRLHTSLLFHSLLTLPFEIERSSPPHSSAPAIPASYSLPSGAYPLPVFHRIALITAKEASIVHKAPASAIRNMPRDAVVNAGLAGTSRAAGQRYQIRRPQPMSAGSTSRC